MPIDGDALLHLLKASKPEIVNGILVDAFRYRHSGVTAAKSAEWAKQLGISAAESSKLFDAVDQLIRTCLFENLDKASVHTALPKGFHPSLTKLLAKIITAHMAEWREAVVSSQVGPPKLVDFDWRVDLKTASNHLSRMAVPTVLVSMKVQNQPTEVGVMPSVKDVQFEMGASALNTLLDGLGKIRDQLGSIQ